MSIVFDFEAIAARVNRKPEPAKFETHTLTIAELPQYCWPSEVNDTARQMGRRK